MREKRAGEDDGQSWEGWVRVGWGLCCHLNSTVKAGSFEMTLSKDLKEVKL